MIYEFVAVIILSAAIVNLVVLMSHLNRIRILERQVDRISQDMSKIWTRIFTIEQVTGEYRKQIDAMKDNSGNRFDLMKAHLDDSLLKIFERLDKVEEAFLNSNVKKEKYQKEKE